MIKSVFLLDAKKFERSNDPSYMYHTGFSCSNRNSATVSCSAQPPDLTHQLPVTAYFLTRSTLFLEVMSHTPLPMANTNGSFSLLFHRKPWASTSRYVNRGAFICWDADCLSFVHSYRSPPIVISFSLPFLHPPLLVPIPPTTHRLRLLI